MKELTTEKDTIDVIKQMVADGQISQDVAEKYFPKLKESDDEKMLRVIREGFNILDKDDEWYSGVTNGQILAWLEKRGEQKPVDKVEPKFHEGEWLCENEPNNYARFIQILETVNVQGKERYRISRDIHNDEDIVEFDFVEKYYHKFDIKDVKDGDVIVSQSQCDLGTWYGIFKSLDDDESMTVHCYLARDGRFETRKELCFDKDVSDVKPATKEQRDTLMKEMANAGYTFNFESKELKKIWEKPDMIQWKGDNLKEVIDFTGKDKNFDKWFKSFAEYERYVHEHNNIFKLFNEDGSHYEVPVGAWIVKTPDGHNVASKAIFKNKPAEWSEEDENIRQWIISDIEKLLSLEKKSSIIADKEIDWLKSLKDRVGYEADCTTKKEWSKEDEKKLNRIYMLLTEAADEHAFSTTCRLIGDKECVELRDFLKSLKPQNHWKPSENQIKEIDSKISTSSSFTRNYNPLY